MGRPQEFFGAGMWSENATSAHHPPVFVLEERHADWTRWIELHRYPTREIAEEHLERLVEAGAPRDEVRVEKRRIEDDDPTRG
ncbi:MAG TPA: hypothetical protein VHM47_05305 [Actinomycetota bacterium]|jgi:hypothetical protein|nr:hypothetical protein [Actinomycetota bacterium]